MHLIYVWELKRHGGIPRPAARAWGLTATNIRATHVAGLLTPMFNIPAASPRTRLSAIRLAAWCLGARSFKESFVALNSDYSRSSYDCCAESCADVLGQTSRNNDSFARLSMCRTYNAEALLLSKCSEDAPHLPMSVLVHVPLSHRSMIPNTVTISNFANLPRCGRPTFHSIPVSRYLTSRACFTVCFRAVACLLHLLSR
jgi:hypothetical protein